MTITLESVIKCPTCGHQAVEIMLTNACTYFYKCSACQVLLKPLVGDCCVFCSYGSAKCPPIQEQKNCCG